MWTLAMIAVGILIGWQLPQPDIVKRAQASFVAWVRAKLGG